MKELLFKQFEKEVKEVRKDKVEVIVERIDSLIESVNENNLKMSVLNIKINFDNMIMDGQDYKQKDSIREELFTKYTNVETFKNGLVKFKEALVSSRKLVESNKPKDVESKASFTETVVVEESKKEEVVVDSNTTFTNTVVVENTNTVQQPIVSESSNNKSLMEQVIQKCNQEAGTISRDLMEAEQVLRNNQVATNVVNDVVVDNMNVVVQETIKDTVEDIAKCENKVDEESVKPNNKKVEVKQEKQQTKSKDMCKYEDCTNKKHTRGYCYKHYKELKEKGIIGGGNNNAK